ncbi:MAG TPA: ribonuclease P protein component [Chloroflexota bacterium]
MKRQHRLRRDADFQRVRSEGRAWPHPLLIFSVAPSQVGATRVGIVVSRRVGKAVVRNRVKRRLREAVRRVLPNLRAGYDIVVIARPSATQATVHELVAAVEEAARRAKVLGAGFGGAPESA